MNEKILGHELIESQLSKLIRSSHVFPAYIFTGSSGIGKGMMARHFAKCLLANIVPNTDRLIIAEDNPVNRMVDNCIHPDLFVLEKKAISIDDVRSILQNLYKRPVLSKWRIVIFDNMTFINRSIANALLKVIEEPPSNTVIIITTAFTGALPKTLLSRLHKVFFKPLSQEVIAHLLQIKGINNSTQLAEIADGSIGRALAIHQIGGIDLYNKLRKVFMKEQDINEIKYVIEQNICCDNFSVICNCLLHIFREYMHSCLDVSQYDGIAEEVLQRIHLLNHCELLQMDKNAVLLACISPIQLSHCKKIN